MKQYTVDDAISLGIIDPDVHDTLLSDAQHLCERAGIKIHHLYVPLAEMEPTEVEVSFVGDYRRRTQTRRFGLIYQGAWPHITQRLAVVCAAYIRNFVDANLVTFDQALAENYRKRSVLCIHDFWAGTPHEWKREKMISLLLEREAHELTTILYVPVSGQEFAEAMGPAGVAVVQDFEVVKL